MNKTELINAVATSANLSKTNAARAIDAMTSAIIDALKKQDTVTLIGFGTFKVNLRAARAGRNPRTGAKLSIPARKVPVFSAGKTLKDAVN